MAKFINGDIMKVYGTGQVDIFLFAACGLVNNSTRKLNMATNLGKKLLKKAPGLDEALGAMIQGMIFRRQSNLLQGQDGKWYGIQYIKHNESNQFVGAFQAKRHPNDPTDMILVSESCSSLTRIIFRAFAEQREEPLKVALEMPDYSNEAEFKKLIRILGNLPDCVTIWRWKNTNMKGKK